MLFGLVAGFILGAWYGYYQHLVFLRDNLIKRQDELAQEISNHNRDVLKLMELQNENMSLRMEQQFGKLPEDWTSLLYNIRPLDPDKSN